MHMYIWLSVQHIGFNIKSYGYTAFYLTITVVYYISLNINFK